MLSSQVSWCIHLGALSDQNSLPPSFASLKSNHFSTFTVASSKTVALIPPFLKLLEAGCLFCSCAASFNDSPLLHLEVPLCSASYLDWDLPESSLWQIYFHSAWQPCCNRFSEQMNKRSWQRKKDGGYAEAKGYNVH